MTTQEFCSETALWDAVAILVSTIDARNRTFGHSVRVSAYAVQIAQAIGWHEHDLEEIRLGALLHDIGQLYWPHELLHKRGAITEEDRKIIESHTYKGAELIEQWPSLQFALPYILYHQEWIDGSGYPYGIKGEAVPPKVQIVSLADVYEAFRHPRSYKRRTAFSPEEAIEKMRAMRGKRWKEDLFDIFANIANQMDCSEPYPFHSQAFMRLAFIGLEKEDAIPEPQRK